MHVGGVENKPRDVRQILQRGLAERCLLYAAATLSPMVLKGGKDAAEDRALVDCLAGKTTNRLNESSSELAGYSGGGVEVQGRPIHRQDPGGNRSTRDAGDAVQFWEQAASFSRHNDPT